jgi:hypothetical protein
MAKPDQPLPTASLSREEVARIEVGHTRVDAFTARVLVAGFLAAIAIVPIVEGVGARALRAEGASSPWGAHLSGLPREVSARLSARAPEAQGAGAWRRTVLANRRVLASLTGFERALEEESFLGRSLRVPAQLVMTRWLGVGNERVYRGRDGWLFYRPDVEYLTGPGFLDRRQMRRRVAGASEWEQPPHPDPREAIVRLKRDLEARGIALVVVPTPLKPALHPEKLASGYASSAGVLKNPSFDAFVEDLRREDVLVFDVSEALAAEGGGPHYLETDTHWRPEAMELVVERLSAFIGEHAPLPRAESPGYRIDRVDVRNAGDTARMLDLPEDVALYPPESVWVRRVLQADGSPWRSSRDADVLVLGDSFTNIYALESMGWGTGAGLAEQLSYTLRRPVDRLVQNDEGAFATRAMLARDPARLAGTRVVIYQFAARELAFGDWQVLGIE